MKTNKKTRLAAYLDGELVGTRTTARTYTHAVVTEHPRFSKPRLNWAGSADLAEKEAARVRVTAANPDWSIYGAKVRVTSDIRKET